MAIQAKTRKLPVGLPDIVRSRIADFRAEGVLIYVVVGISIWFTGKSIAYRGSIFVIRRSHPCTLEKGNPVLLGGSPCAAV